MNFLSFIRSLPSLILNSDVQDISDNITSIVKNDPRVTLVSIDVTPSQYSITITLMLRYTDTNELEQMILAYNENMDNF